MVVRKIMGGLAVLAITLGFAASPALADHDAKHVDPPQTKEQNQDHVVGEELC